MAWHKLIPCNSIILFYFSANPNFNLLTNCGVSPSTPSLCNTHNQIVEKKLLNKKNYIF